MKHASSVQNVVTMENTSSSKEKKWARYAFSFLLFLLVFAFSACTDDNDGLAPRKIIANFDGTCVTVSVQDFKHVYVNDSTSQPTSNILVVSKEYQMTWSHGDSMGIFCSQKRHEPFAFLGKYDAKAGIFGSNVKNDSASVQSLAYFPFRTDSIVTEELVPVSLQYQVQAGNNSTAHLHKYDFMTGKGVWDEEQGLVTFQMQHQVAVLHFDLNVPDTAQITKVLVVMNQEVPVHALANLTDSTSVAVNEMPYYSLDVEDVSLKPGQDLNAYVAVSPLNMAGKNFEVVAFDEDAQAYSCLLKGENFEKGNFYHYTDTLQTDSAYSGIVAVSLIDVVTKDGELPTCDEIEAPKGSMGTSITNVNKVKSRLKIFTVTGENIYDSGDYKKDESGMTIKVRGNTSAQNPDKYPYKIKLQKKADLLFCNDSVSHTDKNWVLLKPNFNTMIGYEVSKFIGMEFVPQAKLVNVWMNGKNMGNYILSESIERNEKCRINVDKSTGFIIERDAYWWNEDVYFNTPSFDPKSFAFTFKYPDPDDVTPAQVEKIQKMIEEMENSISEGHYPQYIDVSSFATWLLGQDILGTSDAGGTNMYFAKYDNTSHSKITMPVMWDFDAIGNQYDKWSTMHTIKQFSYFPQLLTSQNKSFLHAYQAKWNAVHTTLCSHMENYMEQVQQSPESKGWGTEYLQEQLERWRDWFADRIIWLEIKIDEL